MNYYRELSLAGINVSGLSVDDLRGEASGAIAFKGRTIERDDSSSEMLRRIKIAVVPRLGEPGESLLAPLCVSAPAT